MNKEKTMDNIKDIDIENSIKSPPEMIKRLLEIINSGIIVSDLSHRIIFINKKAASLFGTERECLNGEKLESLFMEEDRQIFLPNILHMVRTHGDYEGEAMMRKVDGTGFITLLSASIMPVQEQENIVFTINDISRLKGIEKALQRSKRMLYLGSILDDISHQIRNPVLTIGGFARRLMKTGVNRPEYTEIILEEAARLELLVTTLTEFTNMPKPRFRMITKDDLIKTINKSAEKLADYHQNRIETIVKDDITCNDVLIDPALFIISLENVLTNACEAVSSPEKKSSSPEVRVEVGMPSHKDMVCAVRVVDNGEGIREKIFPRIFHPFFTTKTGHIGMGLTFTKQIQEELGGSVALTSEFMTGTTVTLEFAADRRRSIRRKIAGAI